MANYTVDLRTIVNSGVNIFDFPYPFYDESRRKEFEEKFIHHFYFREIGSETVERFKFYLQDKMNLVFPYYNELFNAATIKYNVLDNYNITEEYTIEREDAEKKGSISSSVGQTYDDQTTNRKDSVEAEGKTVSEGTEGRKDVGDLDTNILTIGETDATNSSIEDSTVTSESDSSLNKKQWYLDTPQGKIDSLSKSDYITNFTENQDDGESTGKETRHSEGTYTSEGDSRETVHNMTKNTLISDLENNSTVTSENTSSVNSDTTFKGEQKSTYDNNTREETVGKQVEKSVFTKKGNIGVDTDSDMIHKHISLQKILRRIELMFFDECEDLFMLIY